MCEQIKVTYLGYRLYLLFQLSTEFTGFRLIYLHIVYTKVKN